MVTQSSRAEEEMVKSAECDGGGLRGEAGGLTRALGACLLTMKVGFCEGFALPKNRPSSSSWMGRAVDSEVVPDSAAGRNVI